MRLKYRYEYRINKKGAECFRSRSLEEIKRSWSSLIPKGLYIPCRVGARDICQMECHMKTGAYGDKEMER